MPDRTVGAPIDDAALDGPNNFHLLRLAAALLVLFAHAFHLVQRGSEEPIGRWFVWLDASLLGVAVFFFVSGFLVSRSWDRRRNLRSFIRARALRIVPAYWAALLATVFGLGLAATTLPRSHYLTSYHTYEYLVLNAVLVSRYLLPGVFAANPVPGVNGSLWTIPLEVVMYALLAIAGWLGVLASTERGEDVARSALSRIALHPLIGGMLVLIAVLLADKVLRTGVQYYRLAGYFLLGVLCYRFRERLTLRLDVALALAIAAVALGRTSFGPIVMPIALAAVLLCAALHPALAMRPRWLHRHDYSYGTYLYGFPVQQSLIAFGIVEPLVLFGCAIVTTLALAALSWHWIERPALARKSRASPA